MHVYIACGLSHVPSTSFEAYTKFIHELASALEDKEHISVSYPLRDSNPLIAERPSEERARLCYLKNRELISRANVVIAEMSHPSVGLGIELQLAADSGTPIVLCHEAKRASAMKYANPDQSEHYLQIGDGHVSLMALGIPTISEVISYSNQQEAKERILSAVATLALRLFSDRD